jgi:hypothetical protein
MKTIFTLAMLMTLTCGSWVRADIRSQEQGTLNVTVVDENGAVVNDAPVYIYGEHRTHFVGGTDVPGTTTFSMKEGKYRVSSALIKRSGDDIDRYASNEAHLDVVAGDNVTVVLTLKPLRNPEQQPQSYATLHVAGIPSNLLMNN